MPATDQVNLPTDFDEELNGAGGPDGQSDDSPQPAKDENGIPYCRLHHCRMKQVSGGRRGKSAAYYTCPVDECKETAKRIKTSRESSIPSDPTHCQGCSTNKKPIVMERSPRLSSPYYTILVCPSCGRKSGALPRPEFVASYQVGRRQSESTEIGDR